MGESAAKRSAAENAVEVLTVREAAELLRVSADVLCASADAGDVPCLRVGKRRRFSREAILRWMSEPHPDSSRCSQGAPESAANPAKPGQIRRIRG